MGANRITVEIDPQKKLAESDESNNSFEVTIFVEP
jgi:subtilase family serine protease